MKEKVTIEELYKRLLALEVKIDTIGATKLETLKEVRLGVAILIVLSLANIFVHAIAILLE
jgi:hypothetical protein